MVFQIPEPLAPRELSGQSRGHVFFTQEMHSRKQIMMHLSDAFIALPGGLGTYEEVLDATTWSKLGIHSKPTGLLNISGFFDGLLEQVETCSLFFAQFVPLLYVAFIFSGCIDSYYLRLHTSHRSLHNMLQFRPQRTAGSVEQHVGQRTCPCRRT
jgi:hypothetical protein